jgi:hypothetical protein
MTAEFDGLYETVWHAMAATSEKEEAAEFKLMHALFRILVAAGASWTLADRERAARPGVCTGRFHALKAKSSGRFERLEPVALAFRACIKLAGLHPAQFAAE